MAPKWLWLITTPLGPGHASKLGMEACLALMYLNRCFTEMEEGSIG